MRGIQDALERAWFASLHRGIPQKVVVVGEDEDRVIRRYEDGREVAA